MGDGIDLGDTADLILVVGGALVILFAVFGMLTCDGCKAPRVPPAWHIECLSEDEITHQRVECDDCELLCDAIRCELRSQGQVRASFPAMTCQAGYTR